MKSGIETVTAGIVVYNTPLTILRQTLKSLRSAGCTKIILLCNSDNVLYRSDIQELTHEKLVDKLMTGPNRGFGYAHNTILKEAETPYYLCCNPDIVAAEDAVNNLVLAAERHTDGILFCPRVLNDDGSTQLLARQHLTLPKLIHRQLWRLAPQFFQPYEKRFDYSREQTIEFVSGCFFLARTDRINGIGGFNPQFFLYCEDADLSRRADRIGKNFFVPSSTVHHRWNKGWTKSPKHFRLQLQSLIRYFAIHGFFR